MSRAPYRLTKTGLALTILLAPLYVLRFKIGGVPFINTYPTTLLEILILLTAICWLAEKIKAKNLKLGPIWNNLTFPLPLFIFSGLISVLVSPDKSGALGVFKAYLAEPILIYLIILDVVKTKKDGGALLKALLISGGWVAALTIVQGLTEKLVITPYEMAQGRSHAVFNTANAVGLYLGPILALGLGALAQERKVQSLKLPFLALLTGAIILSKSGGALVATGTVVALCLFVHRYPRPLIQLSRRVLLAALIATLGIFLFVPYFAPKVLDPHHRTISNTTTLRFCLWEGTRNLLLARPVLGAGLSGFKELYSTKYYTCDAEPLEYPHNIVFNFWAELGILGLISFGWIVWKQLSAINRQQSPINRGFALAIIYTLIHGLVDVPYFKNDLSLEFWVLLGLYEALANLKSANQSFSSLNGA